MPGFARLNTFSVQLNAMAFPAPVPPGQDCVGDPATAYPQPLQMFYTSLWDAYYGTAFSNPVGFPMSLASNSGIIPPIVRPGQQGVLLTLTCTGLKLGPAGELPLVSFDDGNIGVRVLGLTEGVTYAVPGNSYPSTVQALAMELLIGGARPGLHTIEIRNAGGVQVSPAPAFLNVQSGSPS